MISTVIVRGQKFTYPVFDYMSTYIFEYALENNIDIWTTRTLTIEGEPELEKMIYLCEEVLCSLLKKFHTPPNHKERSNHPSRFRKIYCGKETYVVNYRTNIVGKEAFAIQSFKNWLIDQRS